MKAWCIWCETGDNYPPMYEKNGMIWIHERCFFKWDDMKSDIKHIKESLEKDEGIPEIKEFLSRMEIFRQQWDSSMELVKKIRGF